ncbi:PsaM subunit of photosystem I reaction center [Chloropicon roscoffensis]|uniref:PsaM subunit of photosystem I reaction center n=1 Tax=Chloropicon roscoffensis TaxID=1461544 RepID=A0AAX4PBU1_9CHLO
MMMMMQQATTTTTRAMKVCHKGATSSGRRCATRMMVKANNNAKVAKVAGVAGVAVTAGTTLAAQGALAANEAYQVAATFNLEDGQVFGAVFISLIAGILATRLGTELYK